MDPALRQQKSRAIGRARTAPATPQTQSGVTGETVYMTSVEHSRHANAVVPQYATTERLSNMRRMRHMDGSS